MGQARAGDDAMLDEFLRSVTPAIEELVTRARKEGHPTRRLGIALERGFDGKIQGGYGSRGAVARRFGADPRVSAEMRRTVVETVQTAPDDEIPTVLVIQCEGYLAIGVRAIGGSLEDESDGVS